MRYYQVSRGMSTYILGNKKHTTLLDDVFFVLFMINSLYITISSFKKYMKTNSQKWSYVFIFNFSCLAIVCISQPVFWAIPFMAWGVYIGAKSTD